MLKNILKLGKEISRQQQKDVKGGSITDGPILTGPVCGLEGTFCGTRFGQSLTSCIGNEILICQNNIWTKVSGF